MRKAIMIGSAVLLVVSIAGFITSLVLNAFVFDDYDAYGDVSVPGAETVHLPAGDVTVSFHSEIIGTTSGAGLPIPDLSLTIDPPRGVAAPQLIENVGATTTVNNDVHRQVWVAHIPETGDYKVTTDGKVTAFIRPRLSFGHGGEFGFLPWAFAGLFGVGLAALLAAVLTLRRTRRPEPPYTPPSSAIEL
jgi:hypothetical protein